MLIISTIQVVLSILLLIEIAWYWNLINKKRIEYDKLVEIYDTFEKIIKETGETDENNR